MSRQKSLYEYILQGIKDGQLGHSFSLPRIEEENGICFADGAMDGITVYHMGRTHLDASGTKLMIKALKCASSGNAQDADATFAELGKSFRAISIIDDLQEYILKHANKLPAGNIYQTAMYLILHSADRESVKFGLSMMELFKVDDPSVKEVIRRVGLSDEFTLFSIWDMLKWDDANQEVFNLIRKVHGWGRIHALEKLEPETSEIREWILLNGIENDVMPSYSALTVWGKADVEKRLHGQLNQAEFKAVGRLFSALIDEGPAPGISEIENAEDSILTYLSLTDYYVLDLEDYEVIYAIQNWAGDEDVNFPAISDKCASILFSDECRNTVTESVKAGSGIRLAEALGIDSADDLLHCMETDFDRYCYDCGYVIHHDGYLDPVVELFRKKLPLGQMRKDPAGELGLGAEYAQYSQLDNVVQELGDHPLCGTDLVAAGLWSPVVRSRHTAVRTLTSWCRILQKPLAEVSATLYQELSDLLKKEVDDDLKEKGQQLLDGAIPPEIDEEDEENQEDE